MYFFKFSADISFDHGLNSVFLEQATHLNDTSGVFGRFGRYDFSVTTIVRDWHAS